MNFIKHILFMLVLGFSGGVAADTVIADFGIYNGDVAEFNDLVKDAILSCHSEVKKNYEQTKAALTAAHSKSKNTGSNTKKLTHTSKGTAITGISVAATANKCGTTHKEFGVEADSRLEKFEQTCVNKDSEVDAKAKEVTDCELKGNPVACKPLVQDYQELLQQASDCRRAQKTMAEEFRPRGDNYFAEVESVLNFDFSTAAEAYTKQQKMKHLLYGGIGGAVLGAGAMKIFGGKDEDKGDNNNGGGAAQTNNTQAAAQAAAKAEQDKLNGLTTINGQEITCFSPAYLKKAECQATVKALCTGERKGHQGCQNFDATYCGNGLGVGKDSNYCLSMEAEKYCAVPSDQSAESPSCQWMNNLSVSCVSNPEASNCGHGLTQAQLNEKCSRFVEDPICKKHNSNNGEEVVDEDPADAARAVASVNTTPGLPGADGNGVEAADLGVLEGGSDQMQELCNSGRLEGCPQQ